MSLHEIVDRCLSSLGGTAELEEVARIVADTHPDVYRDTTWRNWVAAVRKALSTPQGGASLPSALSIDGHGTYRQLALLDEADYRFGIRRYMQQANASRAKAYALAAECKTVHDVWIDPAQYDVG
jgi:hypothetical protein